MSTPMSNTKRIRVLSLLNAVAMLVFTFYWLHLPYTFGDEAFLIRWSALVKKSLLGVDPKPAPEEVLFVDVSGIKTTIERENEFGEPSRYHREVITDRGDLAEFFELVNRFRDELRLVLCDIRFPEATDRDSLLQRQFDRLGDKLLGVSALDEEGRLVEPVLELPYALATYQSADDLFLKYPLYFGDSLKTAPLVLYERLDGGRFRSGGWFFHRLDGRLMLADPIIDFRVRNRDFQTGTALEAAHFTVFNVGTLLEARAFMAPEDLLAFFDDKLVIVGDYQNDVHETPFGEIAGPLLIYNAYLTLRERDNRVTLPWILFLLVSYYLLSYRVFAGFEIKKPARLVSWFQSKAGRLILHALDEFFLLTLITLLSYFIFHIHINILILLIFVKTVEFTWRFFRLPNERKLVLQE